MKQQRKKLIIWRSLVQAQAGPQKRIAPMAVLFVLRAWTFTAGYLLRSWFAPTPLTTTTQSMGLCETNLKPRLVHKEEMTLIALNQAVSVFCFVHPAKFFTLWTILLSMTLSSTSSSCIPSSSTLM